MSYKDGLNGEDLIAKISDILDNAEKYGKKKADQVGTEIGKALGEGIQEGADSTKKDIEKSAEELAIEWQKLIKSISNNKTQMKPAKIKVVLETAEALKDTKRFGREVTRQLSGIKATFNGVEVKGLDKVINKFKTSSSELEKIDWGFGKHHDLIVEQAKQQADAVSNIGKAAEEAASKVVKSAKEAGDAIKHATKVTKELSKPKKKASGIKVREFTQAEYDAYTEQYEKDNDGEIENLYETVDILRQASQFGTKFSADITTSCKRAATAVNRFFSVIDPDKYPALASWKDSILESVRNGYFSEVDKYNGMSTGSYSWGVDEIGDGNGYYVYLNLLDVAKDKEKEYFAYMDEEYKKRDEGLEKQNELTRRLVQTYEKLNELHANEPNWDNNNQIESIKKRLTYYEQEKVLLQDIQNFKEEFNAIPPLYKNSTDFNETARAFQGTLKLGDYGNGNLKDNERATAIYQAKLDSAIKKQEQERVSSTIAEQTERTAQGEKELAAAAEKTAEAKQKQVKASKEVNKNSAIDVSAEELIARDVNEALKQLRSAKNNETTLFTLKGVFEGEDLVEQAQEMVKNIAEQANLSLGKFNVKDDTIKVQLYNEELKVTVDQMYKLRAATEEVESAQLELVSQSFNQNVKALNENTFDVEGVQQRASASIEKVRSSLHGLEYDLTDLEDTAKNISSQDDFNKFNNQLKAAQDNIQAIKNSTVSKNSMNPLANMQRDMQNANIEIETMRIKLEKFGNIDGVTKAKQMLEEMTSAAQQFNSAQDAQGQQSAYNQYSNLRSQFKAQTEYINAVKQLNDSQVSAAKQTDPIREQYKSLLDIINKINSVNSNILKYQGKDGGSGLFSGYISQLQSDKQKLVSELQSITQEINNALSGGFVQGKEFSIPFTNILSDDGGAVSSFLNDTKTQAALTTEEIEKLVVALQKTQNIDVEAAARVTEQFKSVQETYKQITSLATLDKNGSLYKGVENVFAQIMQYKDTLSSDPTQWTSEQSANLQALIDKFNEYGNVLVQAGQKEAQYFAGKTKYTQDTTMDNMIQNATEKAKKLTDVKKQLEEAARSFAQESGASDAFVTNFTQSADGISKLDFSVFDTATNSLRNFRMEMGSVSEGMYVTETTINKSLTNIQAAQKQIQSMSDLVVRLGQSGVNINSDTATGQVSKLLQLLQQLRAETAKGDGADQSILSKLTKDAKLSCAEVERLYKQLIQMQNSINSGEAKSLGVVDLNGDKYSQMAEKIKEFAATFPDAALNIGKLNEETGKLPFTITSAGGEMTSFEAKVNSLNGQMVSQKKGVQQLGSSWDQFKNSLSKTGKQLMTALVGYNVFFKAISEIRKGINYVKEIDLAMTELKKVTDETEASYDRFLKTASKTAGAIGSTVSDFTEATANFARLGYTMEESADMAETAIVYKNVADGLDTVEESTDSIISTMKAFGIESDDTMGIIDRFNEVGNRFAITSAGIGEALQRSASALYEAGNTIDESIGLVTAANSVIQNPEQVGE